MSDNYTYMLQKNYYLFYFYSLHPFKCCYSLTTFHFWQLSNCSFSSPSEKHKTNMWKVTVVHWHRKLRWLTSPPTSMLYGVVSKHYSERCLFKQLSEDIQEWRYLCFQKQHTVMLQYRHNWGSSLMPTQTTYFFLYIPQR